MFFDESLIVRRVPRWIVDRTRDNVERFHMGLYDSFAEAVRNYPKLKKGSELWKAWYFDDFRLYIPSEIIPEHLDFAKYPLRYNQRGKAVRHV